MNFPAPPSSHDNSINNLNAQSSSRQQSFAHAQQLHQAQQQAQHQQQQQQQQQQQALAYQQQLLMNGLNGAGQVPAAMPNFPTPAGHSAELNYIHAMVEELSRQLADNKRALEEVVTGVGRVRNRARAHQLGNEELIAGGATDELSAQDTNMDALVSMLTEALEKAKVSRDANAALLTQYANVVSTMLKQFHDYKQKHIADVAAWHRSYRSQLAEARAENCRLREQIWDVQEHAGRANESLRRFRARYDDDEARWERRVDARAVRQEIRFWRRMAMPELADDDDFWSDDDDQIDPVEKLRLRDMEHRAAQDHLAGLSAAAAAAAAAAGAEHGIPGGSSNMGEEGDMHQLSMKAQAMTLMGGVAMQREDSVGMGMPVPPPRPSSAASTGSSGQT